MGCVRETPQIKMKQHGMCKRNSQHKNEASTGCVRETPQNKRKKETNMGCVRETSQFKKQTKKMSARDMQDNSLHKKKPV